MDSHDACTCSLCSCHVFRSVYKLNIVHVFSANALECISFIFKGWFGAEESVSINAFLQLPNMQFHSCVITNR